MGTAFSGAGSLACARASSLTEEVVYSDALSGMVFARDDSGNTKVKVYLLNHQWLI